MVSKTTRLVRRIILMTLFIVVIYGGVIGMHHFMMGKFLSALANMKPPSETVSVAVARKISWPNLIQAVASLQAKQGTELTPQASGIITQLYFHSGEHVQKGQLLVQINDNVAQAQLASNLAQLENAKIQYERQKRLYSHNATSLSNLQNAKASYHEAQAAVAADRATLANLQIRAPFSGYLGIRQVSLGQFVNSSINVVDIQQRNPMLANFSIPQADLPLLKNGDPVSLTISGLNGRIFHGKLTALGAAVSNTTRTIPVQAHFENSEDRLRPGMFGTATIQLKSKRDVIAVPSVALSYNTYGTYVYVIKKTKDGLIAQEKIVTTEGKRNNIVAIKKGLKPGERVVAAGQVKLYPGAHVIPAKAPAGLIPSEFAPKGQ